jgi:hypothetical protein
MTRLYRVCFKTAHLQVLKESWQEAASKAEAIRQARTQNAGWVARRIEQDLPPAVFVECEGMRVNV